LAGTLRLITNKPKLGKWEAGIDVEANHYGKGGTGAKLEGFINIPLAANMALRMSGYYTRDGGFIDNTPANRTYLRTHDDGTGNYVDSPLTVNNAKYVKKDFNTVDAAGARAALKIDLDSNWTVTPGVIYQNTLSHGSFLFDPRAGDLQVHDFTPDRNRDAWALASLTIQGKLSDWDVTYAGSYFDRRNDNIADYSYFSVAYDNFAKSDPADYAGYTYLKDSLGHDIDPTQVVHTHDSYTKFGQELRLSSPSQNAWRLTAGAFMQRQTNRHIADYEIPGVANAVNAFSTPVRGAPLDDVYYTNANRVDRDYAVFGEAAYDLTHNVTLEAGIRGFKADNTLFGFSGGDSSVTKQATIANCAVLTYAGCPNINKRYTESGETHKVQLKWQIEPSKMVYFTYSTGFRPGGNNRNAYFNGHSQDIPAFLADTLTNWELGWKTSWGGRKLYFNGAVFQEDWNKVQYSLPGILGIYYTLNAGKARSRGVEGSINWRAAPGLTISGNATYIDAKLTTAFVGSDGTVQAPSGTRLPVTPHVKLNATARYETKLGKHDVFAQGNVNYQDGARTYLTSAGESVLGPTRGFTTVDLSAGISYGPWSMTAFVTNLLDERGILSKNLSCAPNVCGDYARLYPTKPQQFGIRSGYRF
jgi:outer membrane receptor protein involved in Fe transport